VDTFRLTPLKVYYCPSRRTPSSAPQASVSGDVPDAGGAHVPGALSDYAAAINDLGYWDYGFVNAGDPPANGAFNSNGWGSAAENRKLSFKDVTDGLSNTILVGEKHVQVGHFGVGEGSGGDGSAYNGERGSVLRAGNIGLARSPTENSNGGFGSYHPGVCQFVFGDGSVHVLSNTVPVSTLQLLVNIHDGQVIPAY
jgi:hypothetical protein